MPNGQGPDSNNAGGNGKYKGTKNDDLIVGNGDGQLLEGLEGHDTLRGLGGDDTLLGSVGSDLLDGGDGADSIDGGDGVDTVTWADSTAGVTVDLAAGTSSEGDTIANVENITGSSLADDLTGDAGANVISAGAGDDTVRWSGGDDTVTGGTGADTYSFPDPSSVTGGGTVTITDFDGAAGDRLFIETGGGAPDFTLLPPTPDGDTVIEFAGPGGTAFSVILEGVTDFDLGWLAYPPGDDIAVSDPDVSELIQTGAGNDTIIVTLPSESLIDGGEDNDTLDLSGAPLGLAAQIGAIDFGIVRTPFPLPVLPFTPDFTNGDPTPTSTYARDTVVAVENVIGSAYADFLYGWLGDNQIDGGAGGDEIFGGGGNDTLTGGEGNDRFVFSALGSGDSLITDFTLGEDRIVIWAEDTTFVQIDVDAIAGTTIVTFEGGSTVLLPGVFDPQDLFSSIDVQEPPSARIPDFNPGPIPVEEGTPGDDLLSGAPGFYDNFAGLGGNDTLEGNDLQDTLDGGEGNDSLLGGTGNDDLIGGPGADYMDGGEGDDLIVGSLQDGDTMLGGEGFDIVDLSGEPGGITVFLDQPFPPDLSLDPIPQLGGFEGIIGTDFRDNLGGGVGDSLIIAGGGNDEIFDYAGGNDTLNGGEGEDAMDGGAGNDVYIGGAGADIFAFGPGEQYDVIEDFEDGVDTIYLEVRTEGFDPLDRAMEFSDGSVIFGDGGTFILLRGISLDQLSAEDFQIEVLGPPPDPF